MVRYSDEFYKPIAAEIQELFDAALWYELFHEIRKQPKLYNSNSALIEAIRAGRVSYRNGVFTGSFNARISRELSKFAKYNGKIKGWSGIPPANVSAAAVSANRVGEELYSRVNRVIQEFPAKLDDVLRDAQYSIDMPLFTVSKEATADLVNLGMSVEMTPELSDRLKKEYTTNQNINIMDWKPERIERLRDMMQKNVLSGYNRLDMIARIESEYNVDRNKAAFLARQETMLFTSTVRDERYAAGGLKYYKWSNSHDVRVVGNPGGLYPKPTKGHGNHWRLGGKICLMNDPSVYADSVEDAKAGRWKSKSSIGAEDTHPGYEYGCRCTMIPMKF